MAPPAMGRVNRSKKEQIIVPIYQIPRPVVNKKRRQTTSPVLMSYSLMSYGLCGVDQIHRLALNKRFNIINTRLGDAGYGLLSIKSAVGRDDHLRVMKQVVVFQHEL